MVAVDAMGGDYAPTQILIGSIAAAKDLVPVVLIGPEQVIQKELDTLTPKWRSYPIQILNASQIIGMDEEPVYAVKHKNDSSIVKMVNLVKSGQAKFGISAGNSGAVMVAANFILGKNSNIERPAIAGLLPTYSGEKVLALDLGASTECKARYLFQFAELACKYSPKILGLTKPRVGLLSNGQEDNKGSSTTKEAFSLLKNSTLNFVGNVEPGDIFENKVDIVVCDGFSGNILLKTMESSVEMVSQMIQDGLNQDDMEKGSSEAALLHIKNVTKSLESSTGGALLLGVNGNIIICHGNSNSQTITTAIKNYSQFFQ